MAPAQHDGGSGAPARMTRFDDLYDQPDPRAYFRVLGALDYRTPHHAQGVFRRLLRAAVAAAPKDRAAGRRPATVLDLCCSYGINAALLNHDVTLAELAAHYTSAAAAGLSTAQLIERDRQFYAARRRPDAVPVVGIDIAAPAIGYARAVGLLDAAFAENLETTEPSPALRRALGGLRLITVTGGASFLSARTFRSLLATDAARKDGRDLPWVAAFVLRTGSYRPIADGLARLGLTTEKDTTRTYPQRRFTDADEQEYAVAAVTAAGDDPSGKESLGHFHTALYVSRPAAQAAAQPLSTLLPTP
ncbi:hypothetical protein ACFY0R_29640 [Streptomyces sp. NPDC001633]|uniref:hypothetical protein n=1 Tax=Streptomyces sp. NPDC001633 TaxID=3364595 RepID=UPI0036A612B7